MMILCGILQHHDPHQSRVHRQSLARVNQKLAGMKRDDLWEQSLWAVTRAMFGALLACTLTLMTVHSEAWSEHSSQPVHTVSSVPDDGIPSLFEKRLVCGWTSC